jgi:hypothetical protein
VTAGSEFDSRTGDPEIDINWIFGINPVYMKAKELKLGVYILQRLSYSKFIIEICFEILGLIVDASFRAEPWKTFYVSPNDRPPPRTWAYKVEVYGLR